MNEDQIKNEADVIRLVQGLPNDAPTYEEQLHALDALSIARREHKSSPEQRRLNRERKQRQRERERKAQEDARTERLANELAARQQRQREAHGLLALWEKTPGVPATSLPEQFAIALRWSKVLGPTPKPAESYRQYFIRLTRAWAYRCCPSLGEANRLSTGDAEDLYRIAKLDRGQYSAEQAIEQILNMWREDPGVNTRPELDEPCQQLKEESK